MKKTEKNFGYLEMITAMIMMGTVGVFVVESGQNPYNVVFFRCLFGSAFLALYCYYRGFFRNTGLALKTFLLVALSGVFLVFNWVLLFASFETASISISTTIYHTQPFFFLLIGSIVFRESITLNKILWMCLAFLGVILVSNLKTNTLMLSSDQLIGVLYALVAAMLWAITAIIVKKLKDIKPHLIALIQVVIGIFVLYPFATMEAVADTTQLQWGYLLILGAVHTCLTYILMYSAFQKLQTAVISVLTFIYPVIAIIADFIVYDHRLNLSQMIGAFLIFFSSYAITRNISITDLRRNNISKQKNS